MTNQKTVFCDIDGCILYQPKEFLEVFNEGYMTCAMEGNREKLLAWHILGHKIILTTGRPESLRKMTVDSLNTLGILYDQLVMGVGSGVRILINDEEVPGVPKAIAISIERNKGLKDIEI